MRQVGENRVCVCDRAMILGNELLSLDRIEQGEMYLYEMWLGEKCSRK